MADWFERITARELGEVPTIRPIPSRQKYEVKTQGDETPLDAIAQKALSTVKQGRLQLGAGAPRKSRRVRALGSPNERQGE